jgi:transketolase
MEMDGNNMEEVLSTLQQAKAETGKGKPVVILMRTVMGRGVDFMEGDHNWHGVAPSTEQARTALAQLEETLGDFPHSETI